MPWLSDTRCQSHPSSPRQCSPNVQHGTPIASESSLAQRNKVSPWKVHPIRPFCASSWSRRSHSKSVGRRMEGADGWSERFRRRAGVEAEGRLGRYGSLRRELYSRYRCKAPSFDLKADDCECRIQWLVLRSPSGTLSHDVQTPR